MFKIKKKKKKFFWTFVSFFLWLPPAAVAPAVVTESKAGRRSLPCLHVPPAGVQGAGSGGELPPACRRMRK